MAVYATRRNPTPKPKKGKLAMYYEAKRRAMEEESNYGSQMDLMLEPTSAEKALKGTVGKHKKVEKKVENKAGKEKPMRNVATEKSKTALGTAKKLGEELGAKIGETLAIAKGDTKRSWVHERLQMDMDDDSDDVP